MRQAILYWDEIGSIVPQDFFHTIRQNPVQFELSTLGLFRPFEPEKYVVSNKELALEFIGIINSGVLGEQTKNLAEAKQKNSYVYEAKFMHHVSDYLTKEGFAQKVGEKLYMDWRLSLLYMALLAKYMANDDESITTPSSAHPKYRDLVLSTKDKSQILPSISLSLNNILPIPREDVSIRKIVKFKNKYQDELANFRKVLFENQVKFRDAKEKNDAKEIVEQFKSEIIGEVNSLSETFTKERIPFVFGLFENILKIDAPAVFTALTPSLSIPVPIVAAGAAIGGTITIAKYFLDKQNDRQKELSENSYSYLFQAQREGIINRP